MSLLQLNGCDAGAVRAAAAGLVPARCWQHLAMLDPGRLSGGAENVQALRVIAPGDAPELHLRLPAQRWPDHSGARGDFALSMDLEEAGAGHLELAFLTVNDLSAPRFQIDLDDRGRLTLLGTAGRNFGEEVRAMQAGLGPCQVRAGLSVFAELLPRLEDFARAWGYVGIVLEPLTYHNAVMYENYGFSYATGRRRMVRINEEFRAGGTLAQRLDGRSPFRRPELAHSARGRSWAIHDGVLRDFDGDHRLDLRMVKVIGYHARDRTFDPGWQRGGLGRMAQAPLST
jgi:hypothetical protein